MAISLKKSVRFIPQSPSTDKHPTQKPLVPAERLILSVKNGGKGKAPIPFVGSGSECVTAGMLGMTTTPLRLGDCVSLAKGWLKSVGC